MWEETQGSMGSFVTSCHRYASISRPVAPVEVAISVRISTFPRPDYLRGIVILDANYTVQIYTGMLSNMFHVCLNKLILFTVVHVT